MKNGQKVKKIVSIILALAMVVTLLPSGFFGTSTEVKAATEYFTDNLSYFSATQWSSSSNSYTGWKWAGEDSTLSAGIAFCNWGSSTFTGAMYQTISSMPAGTYTLSATVTNGSYNKSNPVLYPYVGGAQVTGYSVTLSTSGGSYTFSYSFTLDSSQTNYVVGYYVSAGASSEATLTDLSLSGEASVTYSVASTSTISGATVAVGATDSEITSALASTVTVNTVNDSDSTDTNSETLSLTWDLSEVDTSTAGSYTATYSYTSEYAGEQTGTVTITVVEVSSDQAYKDVVTGSETATVSGEVEWASGNVPGTFESGTLGTSTPSSNGFFASSTSYVALNSSYKNNGTYSARMSLANNQSTFYYGASTSATTTYSSLTSATLSSSTTFTEYTYTFTATATTMYLHFATPAATSGGDPNQSTTYAYLRATMTGLTSGTTYTVSFYRTGYASSGSGMNATRYTYIDDVTVTYEYEGTVDTTTRVYYDYAGTYSVDSATVAIGADSSTLAAAIPSYITADLVLEDSTYSDDEDYYSTQALPVEWDTSTVDTSTAGSYTITGTATYAGETITVTTTVNVVEYGTIISSEDEGDFEDYTQWESAGETGDTWAIGDVSTLTSSWASANTGTYAWNVWSSTTGNSMYLVYPVNGATSGTYTYSLAFLGGSGVSAEIVACSDADDIANTATVLGSIGTLDSSESWTTYTGSFTYSGDDITGTYPAIGIKVTITTGGGWGYLDTFNLSGPIYSGSVEEEEVLTIPDDTETAVDNSDFSSGWRVLNYATFETGDYSFGGYYTYMKNWYWDNTGYDSDDDGTIDTYYEEYDEASAYYRQLYNLTAGTYTMTALVAGGNDVVEDGYATITPMIYTSSGTAVLLSDISSNYEVEVTGSWSSPTLVTIEFELTEAYESARVGVYLDTSTEGCWANVTDFSWYWGGAADQIWDDQPMNGDFESAAIYPWIGSNAVDSTDWVYGYVINQDAVGADGYSLNLWNNSETDLYNFTISQNIRINAGGEWFFDYSAIGENISGNATMTATITNYETGEEISTINMEFPGTYYEWTEYIAGLDVDGTTYLEDASGFDVDEGTVITLTISITLGEYDYVDLDNIKFVQEGYEPEAKTYIAVDCFENGGFDNPWAVSLYWTGTGDVDESEDYLYGYGVQSEYNACGADDDATDDEIAELETNAVYYAYSNDTSSSHTYTLTQLIEVTETGKYNITVDTRGYIYGSAVLVVTGEDGETIGQVSIAPSGTDAWTTVETGCLSIEGDQVITVTVTMIFDEAAVGGTWEDENGDEQTWYTTSSMQLDNFVFEDYVQLVIDGDGTYTPVQWKSSDGYTYYVNGGNYVKGVDISSIISEEAAGVTFTEDVFQMLKDVGVNSVRIRIWNNPYDTSGNKYGGGTNNADVATMIAQRAADVGMSVMLSFHLSDFWADPSAQKVPKAWAGYSASNKASSTATFIQETVEAVANTGADIQFVTVGNETTTSSGVAGTGTSTYLGEGSGSVSDMVTILEAGAQAVKNVDTDIMVGVHVAPTSYSSANITYMAQNWYNADNNFFKNYFDFFSTSVYPYWSSHGSTTNDMTNFASQLATIVSTYDIPTMITEYNWPYVLGSDQDGSGYVEVTSAGTSSVTDSTGNTFTTYTDGSYGYWNAWAVSRQGQADMIQDLNSYFATYSALEGKFIGTYYWEPTWISASNSNTSWSSSMVSKWYTYGCGVATIEGANYLGWSGYDTTYNLAAGSKTDEYTLFNANGSAAASLAALGYTTDTMPISSALAQVSTAVDGYVALRIVGQITLDADSTGSYDSVGFKVEYCDSTGSNIKTIADKDTTTLYSTLKSNGELITPADGYDYYFAYDYRNIPATGTYYFKVITTAKGTAGYQQSIKYYELANGTLSTIDPWDYPGTNASLSSDSYSTLYPSYIQ